MFDHSHYVPILKAKEGEFLGIKESANSTKDAMTPLFEIVNIPWDYVKDIEGKSLEGHLENIPDKLLDCWGNERPLFIDSNQIDSDRSVGSGAHHLQHLFDGFRSKDLKTIPVTGFERHDFYKDAVRSIAMNDSRGICLRLNSKDLVDRSLASKIDDFFRFYGLSIDQVDLLADYGSIYNSVPDLILASAQSALTAIVPQIDSWRTLTFAASSFPVNLGEISTNSIDRSLNRVEWAVWNDLITRSLPRKPTFGDYSISNPTSTEIDPRIMTISANIRYTADDFWLIMRGASTKKYGYDQYHKLCSSLITQPEYCGASFSWGDQYIDSCSKKAVGTGNSTTWRKVGNNHHFKKVVDQIASLV